ncbi:CubicO group peptidase, beta-lactamase class C family [Amycolatopsis tolypomycina]|uniref:CubicO group peptidase, beta-lactamase class C family n=1 Tax=Amycolatopsis tolypomycina TaxID=208445 RepID=A0A1H4SSB9_9PSEU|nr:serine hydrolase domain-containing protein [Amycolatopsis tolypomycina]SEC47067.1 CubicO group peptidase, beta-lactamase class C family [Amycolatopsis tolypomycina]
MPSSSTLTQSTLRGPAPVADGRLQRLLTGLAHKHGVPAAQLVVHDGDRRAAAVAGEVTADAKFPVGSITKAFTAALAMLLVADGDLDPDDPLGEHLDGLGPQVGRPAIGQVLSHTGGLPAALGAADGAGSARRYLRACHDAGLVQPPGQGFSYSNVGYVLVGYVVEAITGMSWWEAMETLLLDELGIDAAFVVEPGARRRTGAHVSGHAVHAATGRARPVAQTLTPAEAAAGALALSASDLAVFGGMFRGADGPLPADLVELMRRPVPGAEPFGLADTWGLGLAGYRGPDAHWSGHDGTADGTSCHLRIDAAHGRVVALTTNGSTGSALWTDLVAALRLEGIPVGDYELPRDVDRAARPAADLTGHYTNGDLEYEVDVRADGDAVLVVDGEVYPELALLRDGSFSVREPATGRRIIGGRFLTDPATGTVSAMQAGGRVARRRRRAS